MRPFSFACIAATAAFSMFALPSLAADVSFQDPKGDDNGPGSYVYPTKDTYKKGSFDLQEFSVKEKGDSIELTVSIAVPFEDPWDSAKWPTPGNGFSMQYFQVYVDTDGKAGSGEADALPGMQAAFGDSDRWEKVIILAPQANKEITSRIDQKAKGLKNKIVLPKKVSVSGKKLTAIIDKKDLGVSPDKAGWQILVGSAEGYDNQPGNGILARLVNEYEGADRFGGGTDGDVDPNFVDCLAGSGKGGADEADAQHSMLKYDAGSKKRAVLKMVRK